jgi:hypothetical protein
VIPKLSDVRPCDGVVEVGPGWQEEEREAEFLSQKVRPSTLVRLSSSSGVTGWSSLAYLHCTANGYPSS